MSMRIVRRREFNPSGTPRLPARLSGQELRGALERFGRRVPARLRPGERMIGGRVFYSAAWLSSDDEATVFQFKPVGFDLFDRRAHHPEPGTRVVLTQPAGCPRNGALGHVFIKDAASGAFYGLCLKASLKRAVA
jgi:hypothetical protein